MEFPNDVVSSLTVPTGAQPGTSRVTITSNGEVVSYGDPPDSTIDVFSAMRIGGFFYGLQGSDHLADYVHAGQIGFTSDGIIPAGVFLSPTDDTHTIASGIEFEAGTASVLPNINLTTYHNVSPVVFNVNGYVIQFEETWHAAVAAANWSVVSLQYRQDVMDNLVYSGRIDYTGANVTAAGAQFVTTAAPTGYRPANAQTVPVVHRTSTGVQKNTSASGMFNTNGTVSIFWGDGVAGSTHDVNGLATGDQFFFNCSVPLGFIP